MEVKEKMELLEVTENNIHSVLSCFGKSVDKSGFIVDKETKQRVQCRYTQQPLTEKTFGGVLPGSEIFIADSELAYAGYIAEFLVEGD